MANAAYIGCTGISKAWSELDAREMIDQYPVLLFAGSRTLSSAERCPVPNTPNATLCLLIPVLWYRSKYYGETLLSIGGALSVPTFGSYASCRHIWPSLQVFFFFFFNYLTIAQAAEPSYPLIAPILLVSAKFLLEIPLSTAATIIIPWRSHFVSHQSLSEGQAAWTKDNKSQRRSSARRWGKVTAEGSANAKVRALWQDWPYEKVLPNPKEHLESD